MLVIINYYDVQSNNMNNETIIPSTYDFARSGGFGKTEKGDKRREYKKGVNKKEKIKHNNLPKTREQSVKIQK